MGSKTTKSRDAQKEETRAHILETALRLFVERGVSATSTRRIAQEAKVSEGLIFYHFPKKKDLLAGISESQGTFAKDVLRIMSASHGVPATVAVRSIADRFVHMLGANSVKARLFQILLGESRTNPELGALLVSTSSEVVQAMASYLRARIAAGELRADLACEAAAMSLLGSFLWFFVTTRHDTQEEQLEAANAYVEQVVDHWLRGALA